MGGRRAIRKLAQAPAETAVVHDMTGDGHGIVTIDGKRVFVRGAIRGEAVTLRRLRTRRNYDEAELLAVSAASADRVEPACRYFGRCGGCSLQHLAPAAQVALKETALIESLGRLGNVVPERVLEPVGGPAWGYRRRARLGVRYVAGKGRALVGFSERDSGWITDMRSCETLDPAIGRLIGPLSDLIGRLSLVRQVPQVEAAVADNAVVLVLRVLAPLTAADGEVLRAFRDAHGLRVWLQEGGPEQIRPLDPAVDGGSLWYELQGLRLEFAPTDFIQVNRAVNQSMIDRAGELLDLPPTAALLDLYCGIGNFTLALGRRAGTVLGVDAGASVIGRARHNARCNGLDHVEFAVADLAAVPVAPAWAGRRFDAVLLDPPRAGAAAVLSAVAASGARRVLYVSCHPGTLARDAGTLVHRLGYRLVAAGILDMFPGTSHVESMALFEAA